jgi:hypothetical protein
MEHQMRAGDWVTIRNPAEILATLDADGTLDGLPFMPEMLEACGRSFRVERRVEKVCVEVPVGLASTRRFAANDVVVLQDSRCDGQGHDGCKRACKIFWREAWLGPGRAGEDTEPASAPGREALRARLKTKAAPDRYRCQSTELCQATEAFPGHMKPWMARIVVREIRNGDRGVVEMVKLVGLWCAQRAWRLVRGDRWLRGSDTRTPADALSLTPGEAVRVKSRDQIVQTLDRNRRNRGLGFCHEMTRCCGAEAVVRERVDRIIEERTGRMRDMHHTVTLRNMRSRLGFGDRECLCWDVLGDCPRGEMMFWREVWLERVEAVQDTGSRPAA